MEAHEPCFGVQRHVPDLVSSFDFCRHLEQKISRQQLRVGVESELGDGWREEERWMVMTIYTVASCEDVENSGQTPVEMRPLRPPPTRHVKYFQKALTPLEPTSIFSLSMINLQRISSRARLELSNGSVPFCSGCFRRLYSKSIVRGRNPVLHLLEPC